MRIPKRMKKICITMLAVILGGLVLMTAISALLYSPAYLYRVIGNGESKTTDYLIFPERILPKSEAPYSYVNAPDEALFNQPVEWRMGGEARSGDLQTLLNGTNTSSLLIVSSDKLVLEYYGEGYGRESINTSFSMAKSVASLLIGIASKKDLSNRRSSPSRIT